MFVLACVCVYADVYEHACVYMLMDIRSSMSVHGSVYVSKWHAFQNFSWTYKGKLLNLTTRFYHNLWIFDNQRDVCQQFVFVSFQIFNNVIILTNKRYNGSRVSKFKRLYFHFSLGEYIVLIFNSTLYIYIYYFILFLVSSRQLSYRYCCMDALHGR